MSEVKAQPYGAISEGKTLNTFVPDGMAWELNQALKTLKKNLAKKGETVDSFIQKHLKFSSKKAMFEALAAEQIDVLAMAIWKIEQEKEAIVNGDETGVGKGRTAAGMIRYALENGYTPIFVTAKIDLVNDLYRDLEDIGYHQKSKIKPFVLTKAGKYKGIVRTDIQTVKDKKGNYVDVEKEEVIFPKLKSAEIKRTLKNGLDTKYNTVWTNYHQFSAQGREEKIEFIKDLLQTQKCILIMDEAHLASGAGSKTGEVFREFTQSAYGVYFLSATYSKRPDTMALYAAKTAIIRNFAVPDIEEILAKGGNSLLEVVASGLVQNGNIFRREKTKKGISVEYVALDGDADFQQALFDEVIRIIQDVDKLNREHIIPFLKNLKDEGLDEIQTTNNKKTTKANSLVIEEVKIQNPEQVTDFGRQSPVFNRLFSFVYALYFAVKAEELGDLAIAELRKGRKPVISFSSTNGAILADVKSTSGEDLTDGVELETNYGVALHRFMKSIFKYKVEVAYQKEPVEVELYPEQLGIEGQNLHKAILIAIKKVSTKLSISPVDVMREKIEKAGYSIVEVSGREARVSHNAFREGIATYEVASSSGEKWVKVNSTQAFGMFNRNQVDVLMLNRSGSTGASAHSFIPKGMKKKDIKPRTMIVAQPQLDINIEVQVRGRINRTGQVYPPKYLYAYSQIPAEKRLLQMLKTKLRTLDAGTTSSQTTSKNILDVSDNSDFLNKYGDKVVLDWLLHHPYILEKMGGETSSKMPMSEFGLKRMQMLTCKEQEKFYNGVLQKYQATIEVLKQNDEYDLELEQYDFNATLLRSKYHIYQSGKVTPFSGASFTNVYEIDVLKKPYKKSEVELILNKNLDGKTPEGYRQDLLGELVEFFEEKRDDYRKDQTSRLRKKKDEVKEKFQKDEEKMHAKLNKLSTDFEKKVSDKIDKLTIEENTLKHYFENFIPGQGYKMPVKDSLYPCVFLGFNLRAEGFVPSSIEAVFAIAGVGRKRSFFLSASYQAELNAIIDHGNLMPSYARQEVFEKWNQLIAQSQKSRIQCVIQTGNLMMIFKGMMDNGAKEGKSERKLLIDFTTAEGQREKGILNGYIEDEQDTQRLDDKMSYIQVPVKYVVDLLMKRSHIEVNGGEVKFEVMPHEEFGRLYMPSSKAVGMRFWGEDGVFTPYFSTPAKVVSGMMTAKFEHSDKQKVIEAMANSQYEFVTEVAEHELENMGVKLPDVEIQKPEPEPEPIPADANEAKIEIPEPLDRQATEADNISVADGDLLTSQEILELIEALEIALEVAENQEKETEITEMIEVWNIVLETR